MSQSKARYIERLKQMVKDDNIFQHEIDQNDDEYNRDIEEAHKIYEEAQIIKPTDYKDWWLGEKIKMNVQGEDKTYEWFYDVFNEIHFVVDDSKGYYVINDDEVPLKIACEFVQRYRNF